MKQSTIEYWDLKKIIEEINIKFTDINKIFLFGSRAYKTNSIRSDIDLLVYSNSPIPSSEVTEWLSAEFSPVDFFKTADMSIAESVINGSAISSPLIPLDQKLDAIELWNNVNGFSTSFVDWKQKIRVGVEYPPTLLPISFDIVKSVTAFNEILSENDLPNTNLGIDWKSIGEKLTKILEIALVVSESWKRGKSFNRIVLTNEYDFQNFIEQVIKPWLPSLSREEAVAKYDGQIKYIDFSINLNSILIEAKHIKDANTEAKVLKEIDGVKRFYKSNTHVKLLIFWTLVEKGYLIDKHKIEADYSDTYHQPIILTKFVTIQ